MKIILVVLSLVLLFGCINLDGDKGNSTNTSNVSNITVIPQVQPMQNTTVPPIKNTSEKNVTIKPVTIPLGMNYTNNTRHWFDIYFIYVGQSLPKNTHGDAILLKRGDLEILIDGGPNESSDVLLNFLDARNVDDIDLLISTNADSRNFGALYELIDKVKVEEFWYSGLDNESSEYINFIQKVKDKGIYYQIVKRDHKISANGIELTLLNPPVNNIGEVYDDSIVTQVKFGENFSMLLTSSIQQKAQTDIMKLVSNVTIMQAPYYGLPAGTQNISEFIGKTDPQLVVFTGTADYLKAEGSVREKFTDLLSQKEITWMQIYNKSSVRIRTNGFDRFVNWTKDVEGN